MAFGLSGEGGKPNPEDDAVLEATWANLSWRAGDFAVSHDLYFGTGFDDVNNGVEGTFAGNPATTFQVVGSPGFPASEGLQPSTGRATAITPHSSDRNGLPPVCSAMLPSTCQLAMR